MKEKEKKEFASLSFIESSVAQLAKATSSLDATNCLFLKLNLSIAKRDLNEYFLSKYLEWSIFFRIGFKYNGSVTGVFRDPADRR